MLFSEANQFSQKTLYCKTSQNFIYWRFLDFCQFLFDSIDIYEIMHKINSNFPQKGMTSRRSMLLKNKKKVCIRQH